MLVFSFLLFYKSACKKSNLAGASYPITRGSCEANLNGVQYSFTGMKDRIETYYAVNENRTYYIRFCQELSSKDFVPQEGAPFDYSDVYVARCEGVNTSCQALITENSWDWRYLDTNNKTNGVIYYAFGEPLLVRTDSYYSFDIQVKVTCDPNEDGGNAKFIFDNIDTDEATLTLSISNKYGCGNNVAVPTPTPTPFTPNCDYTDRYDELTDFGVDIHLSDMNGGPWGIRSLNLSMNDGEKNSIVFFQPCERMECPPGYQCPGETYSSIWICNNNQHTCESYGVLDTDGNSFIEPSFDDLLDGLNLTYKHQGGSRKTVVRLTCSNIMPSNHFIFDDNIKKEGDQLLLNLRSRNSCPNYIPDPTPQPKSSCYFNKTNFDQQSTIILNLTDHDKGDMKGWSSQVSWGSKTGTLYYEPCDNAICPKDAFCEGDEDATVFLCEQGSDGKPDCIAYGLLGNPIRMYFNNNFDITEGVKVDYSGDFKRYATVYWACDDSLQQNEIKMPSTVKLNGRELSFTVYSKSACGSGNPKPRHYHPPRPTPPSEPTPTPQPSVNPTDIYVINDTHYILTPLASYKQDVFKGNISLLGPGAIQGTIYTEFHPWNFIPCPSGYECSAGHKDSNFWACWIEDNGNKYCHSIGDVRILNEMSLRTEKNPDLGAELHFGGVWGLDVYFDIECNPYEDDDAVPFDHATFLRYDQGGRLTPRFHTYLDSGAVCARKFDSISVPTPEPTKTPKPNYSPEYTYQSESDSDGNCISVDLSSLPYYYDELITVGVHPNFQRNLYRYYPTKPGLPPSGYQVLDTSNTNDAVLANIWRCFNSSDGRSVCHAAGNSNVNLQYELVEEGNLKGGVSLNYEGGYGGWSTRIQLICNTSVPEDKIDFDDVGYLVPSEKMPTIYTHTAMACLKKAPDVPVIDNRNSITGGGVFLMIVIIVSVLYIVIGLLVNFIKGGMVELPNKAFWEEFGICIQTAVLYIFTCGKRSNELIGYEKA